MFWTTPSDKHIATDRLEKQLPLFNIYVEDRDRLSGFTTPYPQAVE